MENLPAGEYIVRYEQGGICDGTVDTFLISLLQWPSLHLSSDTVVLAGEEVQLFASGTQTYLWTPNESLTCADCFNPVFTADTTTTFFVRGHDAFGCPATGSMTVTVISEPKFDMPNAFTPNGDGSNDVFGPAYKGEIFAQYQLRIFTRWGDLVFESRSPAQGWNGTLGEQALPSDVYVFVFDYRLTDGHEGQDTGDVTLLR